MNTTRQYGKKADRALRLWVKLARAFYTFSRRTADDIRSTGLTQPQFGILETLGHLGPLPLGDLAGKMLISGGNTTVIVDNLEKEGLVERVHSAEDRRVIFARLTPKGRRRFEQVFPGHAEHVARLASVLTEEEQERLGELLRKLGHALAEEQSVPMSRPQE